MFEKRPNSLRSFNNPCSGLIFNEGLLSNFGSPIAPNKIASESIQILRVFSGRGLLNLSIAIAPTSA